MVWSAWVAISSAYIVTQNRHEETCTIIDGKKFCQEEEINAQDAWYGIIIAIFIFLYIVMTFNLWFKYGWYVLLALLLTPLIILSFFLIYLW